jgi:hypothetical protein
MSDHPGVTVYMLGSNAADPSEIIPPELMELWSRTGEAHAVVPLTDFLAVKRSLIDELEQAGRDIELAERVSALVVEKMQAERQVITIGEPDLSALERADMAEAARKYLLPDDHILLASSTGESFAAFQQSFQPTASTTVMHRRHVRFDVHGGVWEGASLKDKVHEALRDYMKRVEMAETGNPSVPAVDHPGQHWLHANGLTVDVQLFDADDSPLQPIMEPAMPDDVGIVAVSRAQKPDDFDSRMGVMYFDGSLRGKVGALMIKFRRYLGGNLEVRHTGHDDRRNETYVVARCSLFRPLENTVIAPTYLLRESTAGEFTVEECK